MKHETLHKLAMQAMGMPAYPDRRFPPSPYYRFLKLLAAEIGSRLSVELGVSGGGGSLHLAMTSEIAVGVDVAWDHPERIEHIKENFPNFHFLQGDSVELARPIFEKWGQIDLLFIDTTHTYKQTLAEYHAYKMYLSSKAVVCLDDLNRPTMDAAWAYMPAPKIRLDMLHSGALNGGGFGVIYNGS